MTDSLRPTPYPADTRAKGWRFELDHERIRQSDTWALAAPEIRPWLLMLWMTAWEQTPCGSLPADDELIAVRLGMPMDQFVANKNRLLRGWWRADDGRLYHDTMTERVREMLAHRDGERTRKAAQRTAKKTKAATGAQAPSVDVHLSHGTEPGHTQDSHDLSHGTGAGLPRESDTGTGTSTGKPIGSNDDVGNLIRGGGVDNSPPPSDVAQSESGAQERLKGGVATTPLGESNEGHGGGAGRATAALPTALPPDEIVALLTQWEFERGKTPRFDVSDTTVAMWSLTAAQLRRAYDLAVTERTQKHDRTAVNAGFLDAFVAKATAPPRAVVKPLRSMTDVELEAEGRRLGVSTHGLARDQCVAKLDAARRAPGGLAA
ncbi:hypothetical protein [Burkholderia sp. Ac-20345]|uniref:hypothetical protein n=1 Tax=Burkholderia sp. Ac-20345 TaxID=2703891 RepID=UPI001F11E4EE|nr:hypothetical protein [Burkholderia sp. Ac-20345]